MANDRLPRHGHTHEPGGPDPITGSGIYTDDRLITEPVAAVTFETIPQNLHVLELNYFIALETPDPTDECFIGMRFNEDTEVEYGWRLVGTLLEGSDVSDDSLGVFGVALLNAFPSLDGTRTWGRVRFLDYNALVVTNGGIPWVGDGATDNQFGGNDAPETWTAAGEFEFAEALTRLDIVAQTKGSSTPVNIAAGSA